MHGIVRYSLCDGQYSLVVSLSCSSYEVMCTMSMHIFYILKKYDTVQTASYSHSNAPLCDYSPDQPPDHRS
jgi:hypothetical protein